MARLTETDKAAFRSLAKRGWVQSREERSPVFVEPTALNNEAYCQWASELARHMNPPRPIRFTGSNWRL